MAKKKKAQKAKRKTTVKKRKTSKRPAASRSRRRSTATPRSTRRKPARKRRTTRRVSKPAAVVFGPGGLSGLNYSTLENEIFRLTELLQTIRKKNKLVRRSLAYLEREQKKVARQIQEAKRFLTQLKNRGMKALREFPDNAEEIFSQLKVEISRLSRRLGIS